MVIARIHDARRLRAVHPVLRNIALLLQGSSVSIARYIYRVTNSMVDWIDFYIMNHSGSVLLTDLGMPRDLFVISSFLTLLIIFILES